MSGYMFGGVYEGLCDVCLRIFTNSFGSHDLLPEDEKPLVTFVLAIQPSGGKGRGQACLAHSAAVTSLQAVRLVKEWAEEEYDRVNKLVN